MNNLSFFFANLSTGIGKIAGVINTIAALLFFGALVFSSLMYASGRSEYLKPGLIGAATGALSWVIVQALFNAGSPITVDLEMQSYR